MTPPTAWAHLPNAECIDHILAHLAKHPKRWAIAWDAAWGALLALTAYDDCAYMLNLPLGALNVLRSIDDPQAVLLYPAVVAMRAEP